jgi:hypothetical protein
MIGIAIREEHESQFRSERSRVSDPMLTSSGRLRDFARKFDHFVGLPTISFNSRIQMLRNFTGSPWNWI